MSGNGHIAAVVVVDDDDAMRAMVAALLEAAGFRVLTFATGTEALALEERPALLISDVQMPGISGYEVCRRAKERWGDVLFVFLSGTRTEPHDRVAGFALGADDYIVKPFDPEELVARIRALVRRTAAANGRVRAPVELATTSLTPRERQILSLLGEGKSQRAIADELVLSPRTVGKHLERILKKLGAHSRAEAVARAYRAGLVRPEGAE